MKTKQDWIEYGARLYRDGRLIPETPTSWQQRAALEGWREEAAMSAKRVLGSLLPPAQPPGTDGQHARYSHARALHERALTLYEEGRTERAGRLYAKACKLVGCLNWSFEPLLTRRQ